MDLLLNPYRLTKVNVIEIIDGDSVFVSAFLHTFEVRLAAIDCPEDDQPGGYYAKEALRQLIKGRNVYLEIHEQRDRYGRILSTVYADNGSNLINVNEELVKCGHAWVYRHFYNHLPVDRREELDKIESWAQRELVGLWKDENPIPPWEWRKQGSLFKWQFQLRCAFP